MKELVGKDVTIVFALPVHEWPIPGYPAFAVCLAVDMPMIKLRNRHFDNSFWINANCIRTITEDRTA